NEETRSRRQINGRAMKHSSRGYSSGCSRRDFLKGAGALGLTLAAAGRARGMSDFDFTGNFNACPLGPMTTVSKQLAWSNPAFLKLIDSDQGSRFEIITGGKNGGAVLPRLLSRG